jgi:hypothetical protein
MNEGFISAKRGNVMHVVPETRSGKITFYKVRLGAWAEEPESIGLTPESVAALAARVEEARQAETEQRRAASAARSATAKYYSAIRRLHAEPGAGASMIQSIRAYAQTTGEREVYFRALLPPPAKARRAGSAPPPGQPTNFSAQLHQDGSMELKWACDNPDGADGTMYEVQRRTGLSETFTHVGTVGGKRFLDDTLPPGLTMVEYQVTAVRSTRRGQLARYHVNFGSSGRRVPSFQLKGAA